MNKRIPFIENGIDNIQLLVDSLSASGYIVDSFIDHLKASSAYEKYPDKQNVELLTCNQLQTMN